MKGKFQKVSFYGVVIISSIIFTGCFYKTHEEVTISLLSTQIGYTIKGPYGFTGTITKPNINAEEWNVAGRFLFPNQLFFYLGKTVRVSKSSPEQVKIHFYVLTSRIGDFLFPNPKEKTVEFKIKASNDAQFEVEFN